MCDDDIHPGLVTDPTLSRRSLGLAALATAGLAAATAAHAAVEVVEADVAVPTPDGSCDAAFFHPAKGRHPAVLVWPDALGLRPAFREMGRRLAAQGYAVLVVNPYYRSKPAPVLTGTIDFNDPEVRKAIAGYRQALTNEAVDRDAGAYLAWLDSQPRVDRRAKAGVQGYCMGGALSFRTAAAVPARIGAVGSFHGGGLVTKADDSPHLLIARSKAAYLVCVARNDDARAPNDKVVLNRTFAEARRMALVEVYPADHGWCVPGSQVYDAAAAEKAWANLGSLYDRYLVSSQGEALRKLPARGAMESQAPPIYPERPPPPPPPSPPVPPR